MAEGFLCIQAMSSLITLISLIALPATEPGYIQNGMVFLKIKNHDSSQFYGRIMVLFLAVLFKNSIILGYVYD
ncbi:hypothetical protein DFO73_106143 [Cytobacillus oceanisediminis]|uniref:Uncharacterized protein n=1 Tax=Cytobacillus oceanisediminis TaxID=665099 RepID=A0A2V2ZWJ8_9BACI|nr:hypothetical protein DFO73_106143 [Cytobacillus oceanisediminis]